MDPVAHTLFGAALAEAGLKRKTALATGTLIIGANLPDVDAIAMFMGTDYALLVRRGWTHGLPALILWPFLLTGFMLLYDRIRRQRRNNRHRNGRQGDLNQLRFGRVHPGVLLGISFLAVWSHPFLDWLNTYGIRLLMPFDDTWFYGDTLFIIDPWIWLLIGSAVVLARSDSFWSIAGWVVLGTAATALITGTAIVPRGVKILWSAGVAAIIGLRWLNGSEFKIRQIALISLLAVSLYLLFMFTGSRISAWEARQQLSEKNILAEHIMAAPQPGRLLTREGVAASSRHYYRFRYNWLKRGSFEFIGEPIPIEEPDEIVQKALESPDVQGLRNWMRFPYYEVEKIEKGWRVYIRDLRQAGPDQREASGIGMAVVDVKDGEVENNVEL